MTLSELNTSERIGLVLIIAIVAHLAVYGIRYLGHQLMTAESLLRWNKLRTLAGLLTSILVFGLYFGTLGFVLQEFGVSLTAYLASASILGLAIGFGSQGVVQDVVTGLTVILTDLFQVGDLVEIGDKTGTVQNISMRFTTLLNPLGAKVFIPNRTLSNVTIYPRGYLRCYADVTLSTQADLAAQMQDRVEAITRGFVEQFPGILRDDPEFDLPVTSAAGRVYLRIKFRVWPGRIVPIEQAFKNEIIQAMKLLDPDYADWMVSINNEISEEPRVISPFRSGQHRRHGSGRNIDGHD
ncbi:MAG: mechanosensitive ion channel family protein [Gammaproteobacteria bacterium]|jgi:small conductance mechanosensitive channel|nr:mechanosensitive ion channel family protein [Gammaproteobacteria bacterium]